MAANDAYVLDENTVLTVTAPTGVLANDTDIDGPSLLALLVGGPAHGALALNADGGLTYTPNANYSGADGFTYKANDGTLDSGVATVSLTINHVDRAPVAADDGYSLGENAVLTVAAAKGVLANDTDVDSSTLTAALVAGPAHGTLTLNANGGLSYTPNANYTGADAFTYKANDGTLDSGIATVNLTVNAVNHPPVLSGTLAGQATTDLASSHPFAAAVVTDPDVGARETITLTLLNESGQPTDANGALSGVGLTKTGLGTYALAAGAPSAVTAALEAVTFTPTPHQVAAGGTVATSLAVTLGDGTVFVTDATTSVVATASATGGGGAPTITVSAPAQASDNGARIKLFAGVAVGGFAADARDALTIVLRGGDGKATDANGILTGAGLTRTGMGTYALAATNPATLTRELEALTFAPSRMGATAVATTVLLTATENGAAAVLDTINVVAAGRRDCDGDRDHSAPQMVPQTVMGAPGGYTAAILGGGNQKAVLGGGFNTVVGGNGNDVVTGAPGGFTSVTLGDGNNIIQLGGTRDTVTLGDGNNRVTGTAGLSFISTGRGNDTIVAGGSGNVIDAGGGRNVIVTDGGNNIFVLPRAGQGMDTIGGFSTMNGDQLDVHAALAATRWNGAASLLGNYLKVTSSNGDATLSVVSHGRDGGTAIALLKGAGGIGLADLVAHGSLKL